MRLTCASAYRICRLCEFSPKSSVAHFLPNESHSICANLLSVAIAASSHFSFFFVRRQHYHCKRRYSFVCKWVCEYRIAELATRNSSRCLLLGVPLSLSHAQVLMTTTTMHQASCTYRILNLNRNQNLQLIFVHSVAEVTFAVAAKLVSLINYSDKRKSIFTSFSVGRPFASRSLAHCLRHHITIAMWCDMNNNEAISLPIFILCKWFQIPSMAFDGRHTYLQLVFTLYWISNNNTVLMEWHYLLAPCTTRYIVFTFQSCCFPFTIRM